MKRWFALISVFSVLSIIGLLVYAAVTSPVVMLSLRALVAALVAAVALALIGALVLAGVYLSNTVENMMVATETRKNQSVQFFGHQGQVYIANVGGVPIQAVSHDTRTLILPTEDDPDDMRLARRLALSQPRRVIDGQAIARPLLQSGPVAMPDLLEAVWQLPNVLIVGGKGTGKTTLMQWLAYRRSQAGRVLVFDSHDHPSKWPGADVIGNGRDYERIWEAMLALVGKLDYRYRDFASGRLITGQFERIDNFIDEFTLLPKTLKDRQGANIQEYSWPLLTEGRKVDMNVVWGTHSNRVDALGLKGASDLRECFDCVVYLKNTNSRRYALVDFGEGKGEIEYRLPPPFVVAATGQPVSPPAVEEVTPALRGVFTEQPAGPTDEEQAIIFHYVDMRDNDPDSFSYREVCRRAGLGTGGKQIARVKEVLIRYGIEPI